jgi:hypothetical protein
MLLHNFFGDGNGRNTELDEMETVTVASLIKEKKKKGAQSGSSSQD